MLTKLLIANRGEIACRIMKTCRSLGVATVAVYSDADAQARHVALADEAVHIGGPFVFESYIRGDVIIAAAQRTGAQAIHPGFGFLAENADFAQAVVAAGLIWIGPTAESIRAMGNKAAAKRLMRDGGVPLIPGYDGKSQKDATLIKAAADIGFPIMVKAAAGGGGIGMEVVHDSADLPEALISARREARQAFNSDELILEKALFNVRHVEVQIIGDQLGNIIHLGERDCSVQRRNQKVIEEAPAPGLSAETRAAIGAAAVRAAQAVDYVSAGTVEFLLDADENFYFLEMNTRIQVEHPVTEMITGIDLVAWQLAIADGGPLPLAQDAVQFNGHAIEARVYAENPANNFLPVTGDIALWRPPTGDGIRVDSGLNAQDTISIYYDPMIAKVIAHGPDRATALRRLQRALAVTRLIGLINNVAFVRAVLAHPAFVAGELSTQFIAEQMGAWGADSAVESADFTTAQIAVVAAQHLRRAAANDVGFWRNSPNRPQAAHFADLPPVAWQPMANGYTMTIGEETFAVSAETLNATDLALTIDGHRRIVTVLPSGDDWWVVTDNGVATVTPQTLLPKPASSADAGGSLRAPMPGVVLELLVEVGATVVADQPLLKLEAMKMEHTIRSAAAGTVTAIYFAAGDQVDADAQLLVIEPN